MAADDLVTQGTRTSADIVLNGWEWNSDSMHLYDLTWISFNKYVMSYDIGMDILATYLRICWEDVIHKPFVPRP